MGTTQTVHVPPRGVWSSENAPLPPLNLVAIAPQQREPRGTRGRETGAPRKSAKRQRTLVRTIAPLCPRATHCTGADQAGLRGKIGSQTWVARAQKAGNTTRQEGARSAVHETAVERRTH